MTWEGPRAPISAWLTAQSIEHDFLDRPGYGTPSRPSESNGSTSYGFDPAFGVVHYPVGSGPGMLNLVCCVGTSRAPWPIYQVYVELDGAVTVVSEGRCNQAGNGNSRQYERALADLEPLPPPTFDDMGGNRHSIGITLAGPPTNSLQWSVAADVCAAIAVGAGWSANRWLGHEEWTYRKADPDFDMGDWRAETSERIDDMANQFTEAEAADLRKLLLRYENRFVLDEFVREIAAQDSSGSGQARALVTMWRNGLVQQLVTYDPEKTGHASPWAEADDVLNQALGDHGLVHTALNADVHAVSSGLTEHVTGHEAGLQRGDTVKLA